MKTFLTLLLALITISISSCKKQYACECKSTYSITGASQTETQVDTYSEKMSLSQATSACKETETKLTKVNNDYAKDVTYFSGENTSASTSCTVK